jgi:hypothetical protein
MAQTPIGKMLLGSLARRYTKGNTARSGRDRRMAKRRTPPVVEEVDPAIADLVDGIVKYNHNHDDLGRFARGEGTYVVMAEYADRRNRRGFEVESGDEKRKAKGGIGGDFV